MWWGISGWGHVGEAFAVAAGSDPGLLTLVGVSGLAWDQIVASQTPCFRLSGLAAHHVKNPTGMVSILTPPV